ncbi:NepR family anti-sigma factor [Phaeobacter porticola]|uniref:NepR family anti-sigma factor n=1 Tax=Phaeobacter porticola TaxID=1844006 RepID=UPI000931D139|nr:NepR family anti-sigma factor [Phaeobacter porticola]
MEKHKATRKSGGTVEREIDSNLRRAFDTLASEPIPDRFADLLDQLKAKGVSPTGQSGDDKGNS